MNTTLIEDLSDAETNRRIWGKEKTILKSADRWIKPKKHELDIDKWIEGLIERKAPRRILMRKAELEKVASFCPYYDMRLFLVETATAARACAKAARMASDAISRDLETWIEDAGKILDDMETAFPVKAYMFLHAPPSPIGEIDATNLTIEVRKLRLIFGSIARAGRPFRQALEELIGVAKNKRNELSPRKKRGDLFKLAFVEHLGCYFFYLTGEDPTPDNLFGQMADAAFRSFAAEDGSLKSQVKTVVGRIPEKGFRRWGTHRPSPGNIFVTPRRSTHWKETAEAGWEVGERLAAAGDSAVQQAMVQWSRRPAT